MMLRHDTRAARGAAALFVTVAITTTAANAQPIDVIYDAPTLDRWMYPFNGDPGNRDSSSTFGTFGEEDFDNRDAQTIVGFATFGEIPPGLGVGAYNVVSARLILQTAQDLAFIYDESQDPYGAFLDPADEDFVVDEDAGQPMELYGLGFRNGFSVFSFTEDGPYTLGSPLGKSIRNAFAIDFDEIGDPIDVSLSVDQRFDPEPWAVGYIPTVTPGDFVPVGQDVFFDVRVEDPLVQAYFRQALDDGMLDLSVTSLTIVEVMGGDFPSFYTKENILVEFDLASPARLELSVEVVEAQCPEDIDMSGDVGFSDLLAVLAAWGPCGGCAEDIDGSGDVGFTDLVAVLAAWGDC